MNILHKLEAVCRFNFKWVLHQIYMRVYYVFTVLSIIIDFIILKTTNLIYIFNFFFLQLNVFLWVRKKTIIISYN